MARSVVSEIKRDHIHKLIAKGKRVDGRAWDEYRQISIETNYIETAEGSARVKMGNTDVLVGVKMQVGSPFGDTPDKGVLSTNAELIPMGSPNFEAGPPDENSIELARVVDRGIRESGMIDLERLCIEKGKEVLDQLHRHLRPGLRWEPVRRGVPGRGRGAEDMQGPGPGERKGRGLHDADKKNAHILYGRTDRKRYIVRSDSRRRKSGIG